MTTERFINGTMTPSGYTAAFGTEIESLPSLSAVLSTIAFDPTSGGTVTLYDTFGQISMALGSMTTGAGSPYAGFSMYPLNADGTSYADGLYGSQTASEPATAYQVVQIPMAPSVTSTAITGSSVIFPLPFIGVKFKLVMYNSSLSGAVPGSGPPLVWFRSFNPNDT
jgi:hypothetical protein